MAAQGSPEIKTIWEVPLRSLFPMVLVFYQKEKDNIALDYGQRAKLLAFYRQEKSGPYSPEKGPDTGYLDIMGMERRKAWQALGSMSQEEAQQGLISLLDAATPRLRAYVANEWRARSCQRETEESLEESQKEEVDTSPLNEPSTVNGYTSSTTHVQSPERLDTLHTALAPVSMWCSPRAARPFINEVKKSPHSTLTLAPGETVMVRVQTSAEASAIFWEFVTETGDVGFGVNFQQSSDEDRECPSRELLPVVRRDCSEDLVLGSHQYQVPGTYYLHFDNSHSTDTATVVYYKVFYQSNAIA